MTDDGFNPHHISDEGERNEREIEALLASRGIAGVNATMHNLHVILDYKEQRSQRLTFDQAVSYVSTSSSADELWNNLSKDGLIRTQQTTN
jgi:hypothetical protein